MVITILNEGFSLTVVNDHEKLKTTSLHKRNKN